jgi:hypothetical protein
VTQDLQLPPPFVARAARRLLGAFSRRLTPRWHDWLHRPRGADSRSSDFFLQAPPEDASLPSGYEVDLLLAPWWLRKLPALSDSPPQGPCVRQLQDVLVLRNGLICRDRRILECSSLFRRLSPARILEAAEIVDGGAEFDSIPEAVLVARSTNDQGTFGDYVIEFLLPFAWVSSDLPGPYLLDADFVRRFAPGDLAAKECQWTDIPPPGLRVGRLSVVGPAQHWDNFAAENIDRVRAHFGIAPARQAGRKIFLSRLGFVPDAGSKQTRSVINEAEVESLLLARGFVILRPHTMDNDSVRAAIRQADVVVAAHGAAMTHLMFAQPSAVVELASVSWWVPCYLKMCRALQVPSYVALATQPDGSINLQELASALARMEGSPSGAKAP